MFYIAIDPFLKSDCTLHSAISYQCLNFLVSIRFTACCKPWCLLLHKTYLVFVFSTLYIYLPVMVQAWLSSNHIDQNHLLKQWYPSSFWVPFFVLIPYLTSQYYYATYSAFNLEMVVIIWWLGKQNKGTSSALHVPVLFCRWPVVLYLVLYTSLATLHVCDILLGHSGIKKWKINFRSFFFFYNLVWN